MTGDALAMASLFYIPRGWQPIPIPAREKGPITPGWQHLRIGLDDAAQHFPDDSNIGILLGPASCELADVDLDCVEALALADQYLPPTHAEFGRASKRRSHRLYTSQGSVKECFADPISGEMLVELRAAGKDGGAHQTMAPGSIHPSGERVEWFSPIVAPAVVAASILRTTVAWLAVGSLVRRHVSVGASEHPGADLPDLLAEADPRLGEAARQWLRLADRHAPRTATLRHRRDMTTDEINLADACAAIPNNANWDDWVAFGLAIYACTNGSGHGAILFDDWSAKNNKYDPHNTASRWQHFHRSPPSRTGIGKIIALAVQNGWRSTKRGVA
jgi:hypothetical protein